MGKMRITKKNMDDFKGKVFYLLKDGRKHTQKDIAETLDITNHQAQRLVRMIRLDVRKGKYPITHYVVSSRNGYYTPITNDDFLKFYKTMYLWAMAMLVIIKPVSNYLTEKGYDMAEVRKELKEKKIDDDFDPFQMDEKDHWIQ